MIRTQNIRLPKETTFEKITSKSKVKLCSFLRSCSSWICSTRWNYKFWENACNLEKFHWRCIMITTSAFKTSSLWYLQKHRIEQIRELIYSSYISLRLPAFFKIENFLNCKLFVAQVTSSTVLRMAAHWKRVALTRKTTLKKTISPNLQHRFNSTVWLFPLCINGITKR